MREETLVTAPRLAAAPRKSKSSARSANHDLEMAVPYLLARAGARMGNAFAKAIKPYGISLTEWRVCACLNHVPNQTLSRLVVHSSMDMSALSRVIDRLVAQGLTLRGRAEHDGRAIEIRLSDGGLALTRKLIPLARRYEAVALDGFAEDEIDHLRDMLRRIYANASKLGTPDA
jgi:DNA-binding MarR family transcriptional regulator